MADVQPLLDEGEDVDFDPKPYARLKLQWHIFNKAYQVGAILGSVTSLPWSYYKHRSLNLKSAFGSAGKTMIAIELLLGGMGFYKVMSIEEDEGVEDRVYRLHYNEGQNRVDKFAASGAITGGVSCGLGLASSAGLLNALLGGAAYGTAVSIAAHVATYSVPEDQKTKNKMIKEVME
eukprot:CAMPEP_0184749986 /NCGR_PEP_ID=MMETSP0315-20130426/32577_1 /TAXON_ID=101924 /ORGANISM="Rhodosorus marinus, Strain UTEX LB 2760" /LENGTH=176 /DNA_ID=CAMNT_0027227629 /DNA_START=56 /DNA_END=586 /DNA_ORIENTATION=+